MRGKFLDIFQYLCNDFFGASNVWCSYFKNLAGDIISMSEYIRLAQSVSGSLLVGVTGIGGDSRSASILLKNEGRYQFFHQPSPLNEKYSAQRVLWSEYGEDVDFILLRNEVFEFPRVDIPAEKTKWWILFQLPQKEYLLEFLVSEKKLFLRSFSYNMRFCVEKGRIRPLEGRRFVAQEDERRIKELLKSINLHYPVSVT